MLEGNDGDGYINLRIYMYMYAVGLHTAGTFHGFGSWFDVWFGDIPQQDHEPVILSTSPQTP